MLHATSAKARKSTDLLYQLQLISQLMPHRTGLYNVRNCWVLLWKTLESRRGQQIDVNKDDEIDQTSRPGPYGNKYGVGYGLGHNRLTVIDLTSVSNKPMW